MPAGRFDATAAAGRSPPPWPPPPLLQTPNQVSLFREQGASDPPRGAPAAHGLPTNQNLQPLQTFVQMDPHQSGNQPQQHQFASGYVSTRPNPEAQPPAQEGDNWTVVQHHSTAGKRAAHERARATSDSGRSPAANRTRHHDQAQMHFQSMAQQNSFAPLAAQAGQPPTSQEWWSMTQALGMPAAVYSNPAAMPSTRASPLHSESSSMPVRRKHGAHMAHAHAHARPAFRPVMLVLA